MIRFNYKALVLAGSLAALGLLAACGAPNSPASVAPISSSAKPSATPAAGFPAEAIDFTLPSASGRIVSLSSYRGSQNVMVVFYRAFW